MSEKVIWPWIAVNEYMNDDYREVVVETALEHLPEASSDLAAFAREKMSHISVPGFRSVDRAPVIRSLEPVSEHMQRDEGVATAIICLWSEAKGDLIDRLRSTAESEGLQILPDWTWEEGREGFYVFEDIEPLVNIANDMPQNKDSPGSDHVQLAALWLSRAISAQTSKISQDPPATTGDTEKIVSDKTSEETVTEYVGPLSSLRQKLESQREQLNDDHQRALYQARSVLQGVEKRQVEAVRDAYESLHKAISTWYDRRESLVLLMRQAALRLFSELDTRPDLVLAVTPEENLRRENLDGEILDEVFDSMFDVLQRLGEYDRQRQEILRQVDAVRADIVKFHSDIAHWLPDETSKGPILPHWEDESPLTLEEAKQLQQIAKDKRKELETQQARLRELSWNRILNQMDKLQRLDFPSQKIVWKDKTLEDILSSNLTDWSNRELERLEQSLVDQAEEQAIAARSTAPRNLATDLQRKWDGEKLAQLLEYLAEDERDVEAFLLLMSATAAQPASEPIILEREEVRSILRGLGVLSEKAYPFRLLSRVASDFLTGWRTVDPQSRAELHLIFLAAHYSDAQLSDGFLWQLTQDDWNWPIEEMTTWNDLWQSNLQGNQIYFADAEQEEQLEANLRETRSHAQQMLAREAGRYVSLNSLKSQRHAAMLSKAVMPWLREQLDALQTFDEELSKPTQEQRTSSLKQLKALVDDELAYVLNGESLEERYESEALDASIDDSDPFHRKTTLRTMEECAASVLKYGQSLVEFWEAKLSRGKEITRQALQAELDSLPNLSPLGQVALDQITQESSLAPEHSENLSKASADRLLVEQLLNRGTFASKVPHTVGHLTAFALDWSNLLTLVLADIAEGLDPEEAADVLLEHKAPSQVLLLTKYLSLDIQKQAQAMEKNLRHEVEELYESLLKLGGEAQDLLTDRDLGRWRFVSQRLTTRLEKTRKAYEAQRRKRQTRARQIRQQINELDMQLFEVRDKVPADAHQVIEDGLNLARRATREEEWFEAVESYLKDIRYRLQHDSWPLAKLQESYRRLEDVMEERGEEEDSLTAEKVLNLLERGELEQLGLTKRRMAASKVKTRINLLHNWLDVAKTSGFSSDNLRSSERNTIKGLYRYFAQMVVMDRAGEPSPLAFEEPIVYSYWKLRYHKVDALKNKCIFVAMPGNPPSGKDLSELDYILEEKQWLDDFYVFLFIPGGTPQQYVRLRSHYQGKRLVIIDESAMLDVILAEAQSNKPLWRLRPLMLQAWGSEKADIFLVNQSINLRTGIFVGRDDLIQRITSSGSDYALYGGRRIGKSSVLKEVERYLLRRQDVTAILASFEGDKFLSDDAVARKMARKLQIGSSVNGVGDFKAALQNHLDKTPDSQFVLLLDEIDRYIKENPDRHIFIEALRALSEQYGSRFRVVIAGFMELYDCLRGRGPYSPASDPWGRMLDDIGPIPNLKPESAEQIVDEGFAGILGWDFEIPVIPQRIVQHTGGHPSFVQYFCRKIQEIVGQRKDRTVRLSDIETVFNDDDPDDSFIAHVRRTLRLNLDAVGEFIIPWLALEFGEAQSFTQDQLRDLADSSSVEIPDEYLARSLERLAVTKVVEERARQVYEFSVPDYPLILNRLGDAAEAVEGAERKLKQWLERQQ